MTGAPSIDPPDRDKNDITFKYNCVFEVETANLTNDVRRMKCQINLITDGAANDLYLFTKVVGTNNLRLTSHQDGRSTTNSSPSPNAAYPLIAEDSDWFPCCNSSGPS